MGSYDLLMTLQSVGGWTFLVCLIILVFSLLLEENLKDKTKILHRVVHYVGFIGAIVLILALFTVAFPSLFVKKTTYYASQYDVEAMAEKYNAVVKETVYDGKATEDYITLFSGLGDDQWIYYKVVDNTQSEFLIKDGENNG